MRTALYYFALALLVLFVGCRVIKPATSDPTGNAIERIDVRAESIGDNVKRLEPYTEPPGKPLLAVVGDSAKKIRDDAVDAKKSKDDLIKENQGLVKINSDMDHSWAMWIGRWALRFGWIFLGVAIILRLPALKFTGPWGAALSIIGTISAAIGSLGGSLVQFLFDNLWFRKFKPQGATQ